MSNYRHGSCYIRLNPVEVLERGVGLCDSLDDDEDQNNSTHTVTDTSSRDFGQIPDSEMPEGVGVAQSTLRGQLKHNKANPVATPVKLRGM